MRDLKLASIGKHASYSVFGINEGLGRHMCGAAYCPLHIIRIDRQVSEIKTGEIWKHLGIRAECAGVPAIGPAPEGSHGGIYYGSFVVAKVKEAIGVAAGDIEFNQCFQRRLQELDEMGLALGAISDHPL